MYVLKLEERGGVEGEEGRVRRRRRGWGEEEKEEEERALDSFLNNNIAKRI